VCEYTLPEDAKNGLLIVFIRVCIFGGKHLDQYTHIHSLLGMSPSSAASGVPRTRQRVHKDPPPLDVPDIDDDAAERKRVLNVLAQRRYREYL
jgi:hypothetical protein